MTGYRRGRWWITAGVLVGMPSLFWFTFGRMQNVYGTLLLMIGLLYLRRNNTWNKVSLVLCIVLVAGLLVAPNGFIQGVYGLWTFGALTALSYTTLGLAMKKALQSGARQGLPRLLQSNSIFLLSTHLLYITSFTWYPITPFAVLPLVAQLYMLVLLWVYGDANAQSQDK